MRFNAEATRALAHADMLIPPSDEIALVGDHVLDGVERAIQWNLCTAEPSLSRGRCRERAPTRAFDFGPASLLMRDRCAGGRCAVEQVSEYCRAPRQVGVGNRLQDGQRPGIEILQNRLIKLARTPE